MKLDALVQMLQTCSLHEIEMLLQMTLSREGFGDIEIMHRRKSKQKSRYGGYDLVCRKGTGFGLETVIIKVVRDTVRIRHLSELVGEVDRSKADLGIIVSPFGLCDSAGEELPKYSRARIKVVDGQRLARLLAKYSLGIRPSGEVDYAYFTGLKAASLRIISFLTSIRNDSL
ncbi:MAG: restriction endonuclease [Armatimonadota bacterium]